MKKKYCKIRYNEFDILGFCCYISTLLLLLFIILKIYGNVPIKNIGIAAAGIGVLGAATIRYRETEIRKNRQLLRKHIIDNNLYQVDIDNNGRQKVKYFPCIEIKLDEKRLYIKCRIDGTPIGEKLREQEQAFADCFSTICLDVLEKRGETIYVLQREKNEKQLVLSSYEELPKLNYGKIQLGNVLIEWKRTPHLLCTGITQSGKTSAIKQLMYLLVSQGVRILYLDPKNDVELRMYCSKYKIEYYSEIDTIENALQGAEKEMRIRQKCLDVKGLEEAEFDSAIYVFFDELISYGELVGHKRYKDNIISCISSLITQGAGKMVYFGAILQRADVSYLPGAIRDNLGIRIAMGRQTETAYSMIFPDCNNVRNLRFEKGTGLIYREGIDSRPKELIVPYIKEQ